MYTEEVFIGNGVFSTETDREQELFYKMVRIKISLKTLLLYFPFIQNRLNYGLNADMRKTNGKNFSSCPQLLN